MAKNVPAERDKYGKGVFHPSSQTFGKARSSRSRMFFKIGALKNFVNFTGKHLCWSLFFNKVTGLQACNFIKKETPMQVFFCEICEIFKNTFFHRTPLVVTSAKRSKYAKMIFPLPLLDPAVAALLNFCQISLHFSKIR